jgi:hypothetical protein
MPVPSMADPTARVIPLSKTKLRFLTWASLGFVAAGVWLWFFPEQFRRWQPEVVQVVAAFGLCAIFLGLKQRDPGPGLVIDAQGIVDNSSGIAAGRVPWSEIEGFKVHQVQSQRFLAVLVRDPGTYVARASGFMRPVVALNLKLYGSPIQISAVALQIDFDQLVAAVTQAHAAYARR